jgi:hypothetical protein
MIVYAAIPSMSARARSSTLDRCRTLCPSRSSGPLQTEAVFVGTGAILDVTSFDVMGTSDRTALAFNGRTAVNVGSKRDEGQTVLLAAFDTSLNVVDYDFFTITPQMQTLTVSSSTSNIVLVGIFGSADLQVLVVDELVYN